VASRLPGNPHDRLPRLHGVDKPMARFYILPLGLNAGPLPLLGPPEADKGLEELQFKLPGSMDPNASIERSPRWFRTFAVFSGVQGPRLASPVNFRSYKSAHEPTRALHKIIAKFGQTSESWNGEDVAKLVGNKYIIWASSR